VDCNLQIPTQLRDAKLIDIVDDDGLWNWQLLDTWLPNDIMGKIAALLPPHDSNGADKKFAKRML
jgi:hypothetical protein